MRGLPGGLIGMLALMALVEGFIARHDLDFMAPGGWDYRMTRRAARQAARHCDLLYFGDSMVKYGVVPRFVEGRTGRRGYNLAVSGGQPTTSYLLLKQALEAGARPSAIVVDFAPNMLKYGPQEGIELWPHLASLRDCVELAVCARDAGFFGAIVIGRVLPSVRDRQVIRSNIAIALGGRGIRWREENPRFLRNWSLNEGAQVMPGQPRPNPDLDSAYRELYARWDCSRVNAHYLQRFFRLADSRGIPVIVLAPPIMDGLQARCERSGFDRCYSRFLRSLSSRAANVAVIDGRHAGYDSKVFHDTNHLGREGAYVYSIALGEALRHLLDQRPTPRWIDLPAYREPPAEIALEDLAQSRLALQGHAVVR